MKKIAVAVAIFFATLIITYLIVNTTGGSSKHFKADTSLTWVKYFDSIKPNGQNTTTEKFVIRVITDTNLTTKDTSGDVVRLRTNKVRDSFYYTPIDTVIHTASHQDSLYPNILGDITKWTGPEKKITQYLLIPKAWILTDYNRSQGILTKGIK